MPDGHFAGLREYADDIARQPEFDTIRRRAVQVRRRRKHTASTVVAAVTALVVAALGLTVSPGDGRDAANPSPTPTDPNAGWPRWTAVAATTTDELYAVFESCRACDSTLYLSTDGGRTWSPRTEPPPPDGASAHSRSVGLTPLARGVVVWSESVAIDAAELWQSSPPPRKPARERNWITIDGGRTWQRYTVDERPAETAPAGTRVVDCGLIQPETPCRLYAVDPTTGRFAPLANQPVGIRYEERWSGWQAEVPVGGRLWVPGFDPVTLKPAVAASGDGGRTWLTRVFTDAVPAEEDRGSVGVKYVPSVTAGTGATAYALTFRENDRVDPYRTTDGGQTWEPVPGGVLDDVPYGGFLTADDAHVVLSGHEFRASRDGGPYAPVTLAGLPAELRRLTPHVQQQAPGRYLVSSGDAIYVSDDGHTWRLARMP